MTYDVNDASHHRHPLINALPGAIGTQVGYIMFARSLDWLARNKQRRGRKHVRGTKGLLKAMRLNLRALYRIERRNFALWLRRALAVNAAWRASVLSDLGGERALRRWERRHRAAHEDGEADRFARKAAHSSHARNRRRQNTKAGSGIKTDASGMFRLAAVKAAGRSRGRGGANAGPAGVRAFFPDLKPLGLTPDELRGVNPGGSCNAAKSMTEPQTLWADLLAPLEEAACELAELETTFLDGGPLTKRTQPIGDIAQGPAVSRDVHADDADMHPD